MHRSKTSNDAVSIRALGDCYLFSSADQGIDELGRKTGEIIVQGSSTLELYEKTVANIPRPVLAMLDCYASGWALWIGRVEAKGDVAPSDWGSRIPRLASTMGYTWKRLNFSCRDHSLKELGMVIKLV